jgi:hypothetical protein
VTCPPHRDPAPVIKFCWFHWQTLEPRLEKVFAQYEARGHRRAHGGFPRPGRPGECDPRHNVDVAFARSLAGPIGYHLGGFHSLGKSDFRARVINPNVLGTRCHHLALYVVYDNPMPQVCDTPAAYEGQPEFEFIEAVPTTWDETRFLAGEPGEFIVVARRSGASRSRSGSWVRAAATSRSSATPRWIPAGLIRGRQLRRRISAALLRREKPGSRRLETHPNLDPGALGHGEGSDGDPQAAD